MEDDGFSLLSSPFFLLGADYGSSPAHIAALVDEAIAAFPAREAKFLAAQQILLTPQLRLTAELEWLPELSRGQQERVVQEIVALPGDELRAAVAGFPELARANILAAACSRGEVSSRLLENLLDAWAGMDERALYRFIQQYRQTAELASPEFLQFTAALQAVKLRHAKTVAISLLQQADPHKAIRELAQACMANGQQTSLLFADIAREFETMAVLAPDETGLSQAAPHAGDNRVSRPRSVPLIRGQRRHQSPTIDTPSQSDGAPGQPDREPDGGRELAVETPATRLAEASETAKSEYPGFAKLVRAQGIKAGAPQPLGPFVSALEDYLAAGADATAAAMIIRDLAEYFNAVRNDPQLAHRLLLHLQRQTAGRLEPDMAQKIEADLATSFASWKSSIVKLQPASGTKTSLLDEIMPLAPHNGRADLDKLRFLTTQKQDTKSGGRILVVLFVGFMLVANFLDGTDRWFKNETPAAPPPAASQPDVPNSGPSGTDYPPFYEDTPSATAGQTLNVHQLRYCVFESRRLELLRGMLRTSGHSKRFNEKVHFRNDRCVSYRYRKQDMDRVEREASERVEILGEEAQKIITAWRDGTGG